MISKAIRLFSFCLGGVLLLFGCLGVIVGTIAMLDPVGSKMSDDADPFGAPPSFEESFIVTCVYALIFILGLCLAVAPYRKSIKLK